MKSIFLVLLALISACSSLPHTKKINTADGEFTYYLSGTNKPTVIFESGLGDDMASWKEVVARTEKFANVFAYNRAGFSGSNSKNSARSGEVIVSELRSLLKIVHLKPPYILVGHSLGGAYMELYAKTFPEEVSGIILIDPNSAQYPEQCKKKKLGYCEPPSSIPKWASFFLPDAVEGEIVGFKKTHAQINKAEQLPNVPLAMLSSTQRSKEESPEERKRRVLYSKLHKELSLYVPNSRFIECDTCSHYIHQDQPGLVVDALVWVIENNQ